MRLKSIADVSHLQPPALALPCLPPSVCVMLWSHRRLPALVLHMIPYSYQQQRTGYEPDQRCCFQQTAKDCNCSMQARKEDRMLSRQDFGSRDTWQPLLSAPHLPSPARSRYTGTRVGTGDIQSHRTRGAFEVGLCSLSCFLFLFSSDCIQAFLLLERRWRRREELCTRHCTGPIVHNWKESCWSDKGH